MQGINPLTGTCAYITPCGWCARQNKKCDIEENRERKKKYGDLFKSNTVTLLDRSCDECDHKGWDMPQCKECNIANDFKYFEREKIK